MASVTCSIGLGGHHFPAEARVAPKFVLKALRTRDSGSASASSAAAEASAGP